MTIILAELREAAKVKADGYLEECLAAGTVQDGLLKISEADYLRIRQRYSGLGDAVAVVAKPIARALARVGLTRFMNCGKASQVLTPCQKRQKALNELTRPRKAE